MFYCVFIVCYCVLLCFIECYCVIVFYCVIVCCCVLLYFIVFYCVLLCFIVCYCVLLCFIVCYCVLLCVMVCYCVSLGAFILLSHTGSKKMGGMTDANNRTLGHAMGQLAMDLLVTSCTRSTVCRTGQSVLSPNRTFRKDVAGYECVHH